jgi:hypothetical protein
MPTFNRRKLANDSLYVPNVDPGYLSNSFTGQPAQPRPSNSNWSSAHGSDYQVPPEIQNHPDLRDNSWKNDLSPRFTAQRGDGHTVDVWVEHPDPNARETGGKRFLVELRNPEDMPVEQEMTDDVHEALQLVQRFMGGGTGHGGAQSLDQINERLYDLSRKGPNMTPEESTEYKSLMDKRKQMGKGAPGFLQAWVRRHCKFAQAMPQQGQIGPDTHEMQEQQRYNNVMDAQREEQNWQDMNSQQPIAVDAHRLIGNSDRNAWRAQNAGQHPSGWTIQPGRVDRIYDSFTSFEATNRSLGRVWGDTYKQIMATSQEALNDFWANHPPDEDTSDYV